MKSGLKRIKKATRLFISDADVISALVIAGVFILTWLIGAAVNIFVDMADGGPWWLENFGFGIGSWMFLACVGVMLWLPYKVLRHVYLLAKRCWEDSKL